MGEQSEREVETPAEGEADERDFEHEIAVIGMVGRFPGAPDLDAFWRNLRDGVESIARFSREELAASGIDPALSADPSYVPASGAIDGIELFDAAFFGYSARETQTIDPQQRILLECAWEALEHAGYDAERFAGTIGVFVGVGLSTYLLNVLFPNRRLLPGVDGLQLTLGNDKDYAATRISYKLDLTGPSINVNTACSTSLVAIHLACQSLLSGECDMALAGGACINVPQKSGYLYREGSIASPDGHCRAFDAAAQGTVGGNGAGVVVLKRLADALADRDTLHAVIKGSAINNDGAAKVGFTAPSVQGQARVIREALTMAGVDAATLRYIEAHGTGTPLGDPIEVAALNQAFAESAPPGRRCVPASIALGAVKANIGHLDAAAGVAGFLKAVLALQHRQIPPSLHYRQPNPQIDFASGPFYVNATLADWPEAGAPRRAGVSSFGIGGTNAHVVIEEAPAPAPSDPPRRDHLLVLSARTSAALDAASARLAEYLHARPDVNLADVAYTLQCGRRAFAHRRMLVCSDARDAGRALAGEAPGRMLTRTATASEAHVAFLFPGQGSQYVNMGADLYASEPVFRDTLDTCLRLLRAEAGLDLQPVLFPTGGAATDAAELLLRTEQAQPALFAVEYALAQLWMAWGIRPAAMLGHSLGEYVAACLSGVFSLEDALRVVAARGRLMQQVPPGEMLSVALPEDELRPLLGDALALAAVNGFRLCVAAGPAEAIESLGRELAERDVACHLLHTSHAFHCAMLDPMLDAFTQEVASVALHPPALPYISNITGTWITAAQATDPRYWARHARQTVRFAAGVRELLAAPDLATALLEVGPGHTLATLARQSVSPGASADAMVLTSLPPARDAPSGAAVLLTALGKLWLAGAAVDWAAVSQGQQRNRLPLPAYPFERQRYWVDAPAAVRTHLPAVADAAAAEQRDSLSTAVASPVLPSASEGASHPRPGLMTPYVAPDTEIQRSIAAIWEEILGTTPIGIHDDFFELGGHSLMGTQLVARLREAFPVDVSLRAIFEASTIEALAAVIEARLLEKIEALSDEEAQLLAE